MDVYSGVWLDDELQVIKFLEVPGESFDDAVTRVGLKFYRWGKKVPEDAAGFCIFGLKHELDVKLRIKNLETQV